MHSPGIQVDLPLGFDVHSPKVLASLTAASLSVATSSPSLQEHSLQNSVQATPKPSTTLKPGFAHNAWDGLQRAAPQSALLLLLVIEVHTYFGTAVPWLWNDHATKPLAWAVGVVVTARVIVGLVRVVCTDPGRPTGADSGVSSTSPLPAHLQQLDGRGGWCKQCQAPKPARSHHCSTCQRCVLKMDHHCVFVNTCIGQNNQQHFLRFLVDAVLALSLVQVTLVPQIFDAASRIMNGSDNPNQTVVSILHVCVVFLLGSVVLYLTAGLLLFQLQLVLRNETTIESLANTIERRTSPYDLGVLANVTEAFGCSPSFCPTDLFQATLEALAWFLDGSSWEEDIDWDAQQKPL